MALKPEQWTGIGVLGALVGGVYLLSKAPKPTVVTIPTTAPPEPRTRRYVPPPVTPVETSDEPDEPDEQSFQDLILDTTFRRL